MIQPTQLDNFSRQQDLFDPRTFTAPVTVIGAGATASWLVETLVRMGINDITVWDFDDVQMHNLPNQNYTLKDIDEPKVKALQKNIYEKLGVTIKVHEDTFTDQRLRGIVFCMVDSMKTRKEIWEKSVKLKSSVVHYIEPRMGLDLGIIYNINPVNPQHIAEYEKTFYGDENAEVSSCGTSLTVITSALTIASWCARQLISFHNQHDMHNEIMIDFKFNNIMATEW